MKTRERVRRYRARKKAEQARRIALESSSSSSSSSQEDAVETRGFRDISAADRFEDVLDQGMDLDPEDFGWATDEEENGQDSKKRRCHAVRETTGIPQSNQADSPVEWEGREKNVQLNIGSDASRPENPDRMPDQDFEQVQSTGETMDGDEEEPGEDEAMNGDEEGRDEEEPWEDEAMNGDEEEPGEIQGFLELSPLEKLALEVGAVKASSNISDSAIDKITKVFFYNKEVLDKIKCPTQISYVKTLRPMALKKIPPVYCGFTLGARSSRKEKFHVIEERTDLPVLPKEILHLKESRDGKILLRSEAGIKLKDIMKFYTELHENKGFPKGTLSFHFLKAKLGIDGVAESAKLKGKRSFIAITIQFGQDVFVWKVLHPLLATPGAYPTAEQMIR